MHVNVRSPHSCIRQFRMQRTAAFCLRVDLASIESRDAAVPANTASVYRAAARLPCCKVCYIGPFGHSLKRNNSCSGQACTAQKHRRESLNRWIPVWNVASCLFGNRPYRSRTSPNPQGFRMFVLQPQHFPLAQLTKANNAAWMRIRNDGSFWPCFALQAAA